MRKIIPKRNNTAGEIGEYSAENANQPFAELTSLAESQAEAELGQVVDDSAGTQLGNIRQCAQAVDQFAKQIFYEDVSNTVNIIHLQRHRDTNPPNPAVADIKYELVQHGMCVFFTPKQNNTSGVVTVNLNGVTGNLVVTKPDGSALDINQLRNDRVFLIQYIINNNIGTWHLKKIGASGEGGAENQKDFAETTLEDFLYNNIQTQILKLTTDENIFAKIDSLYDKLIITFSVSVSNVRSMFLQVDNLEKAKVVLMQKFEQNLTQTDLDSVTYTSYVLGGHTYRAIYHSAIIQTVDIQAREAFWQLEEIGSLSGFVTGRNYREPGQNLIENQMLFNTYNELLAPGPAQYEMSRFTVGDSRDIYLPPEEYDVAGYERDIHILQEIDYPIHGTDATNEGSTGAAYVWDLANQKSGVETSKTLGGTGFRGGQLRKKIVRFTVYTDSLRTEANKNVSTSTARWGTSSNLFYTKATDRGYNNQVSYLWTSRNELYFSDIFGAFRTIDYQSRTQAIFAYIPYKLPLRSPQDYISQRFTSSADINHFYSSNSNYNTFIKIAHCDPTMPRMFHMINQEKHDAKINSLYYNALPLTFFDTNPNTHAPGGGLRGTTFSTTTGTKWIDEYYNGSGFVISLFFHITQLPTRTQKINFTLELTYIKRD